MEDVEKMLLMSKLKIAAPNMIPVKAVISHNTVFFIKFYVKIKLYIIILFIIIPLNLLLLREFIVNKKVLPKKEDWKDQWRTIKINSLNKFKKQYNCQEYRFPVKYSFQLDNNKYSSLLHSNLVETSKYTNHQANHTKQAVMSSVLSQNTSKSPRNLTWSLHKK